MMIDIGNIDWEVLKDQKNTLISISSTLRNGNAKDRDNIEGLIYLIEHIQDEAEKEIGELAVFGHEIEE